MPPKKNAQESTPLTAGVWDHINKAYGMQTSHVTNYDRRSDVVTDYEPLKFSSFRVFSSFWGTIFQNHVLIIEQVLITGFFAMAAAPVYIYFNREGATQALVGAKEGVNMREWVDSQEVRMRQFAMVMTVLASLLLSFYTAMAVGRWWVIRSAGVGGIKAATMDISLMVSQLALPGNNQEPSLDYVLDSIRRYSRASLFLVFMWRRKRLGPKVGKEQSLRACREDLVPDFLTEDEVQKLCEWNHCLHETIWAWQTAIIALLHQQGRIKSPVLLCQLLDKCAEGRAAVQCIHTHIAVKIPMQYVHLLGLLVKSHNIVLAIIMGCLFGASLRSKEYFICGQLFLRTLILPLLFNAILLINAELSDPFDGHSTDFPRFAYTDALKNDGEAYVKAGKNMPDWLARRNPV